MTVPSPRAAWLAPTADAPSEEAELVRRARTDSDAFAALYRAHHAAIARYVRRRVGDEHVSGDLVAETFVTALEKLPWYRERGLPFRAWLYRLASTRVNRWVRRRQRTETELEPSLAADVEPDAEGRGAAVELARRALLRLPPRYQSVLALHYLEGLSVVETGRALGLREGTVKARLSRGRERLRRILAPRAKELFR